MFIGQEKHCSDKMRYINEKLENVSVSLLTSCVWIKSMLECYKLS
jgi:hypothetical protein